MKRILALAMCAAILVAALGCEQESTTQNASGQLLAFDPVEGLTKTSDCEIAPACDILDEAFLQSLEYETFTGTIVPGQGAWLAGEMATWPSGSWFSIHIPPSAVPLGGGYPVEFTMKIPVKAEYDAHPNLPLIVRYGPPGVIFADSLSILATYMPFRTWPDRDCLQSFCVDDDGKCSVLPPEATSLKSFVENRRLRFSWKVLHFSDWGAMDADLEDGEEGDKGGGGTVIPPTKGGGTLSK